MYVYKQIDKGGISHEESIVHFSQNLISGSLAAKGLKSIKVESTLDRPVFERNFPFREV